MTHCSRGGNSGCHAVVFVAVALVAMVVLPAAATELNCTALTNANQATLYTPSDSCLNVSAAYRSCLEDFQNCTARFNGEVACVELETSCFANKLRCLSAVPAPSTYTACSPFAVALTAAEVMIGAGGAYEESALEDSCQRSLCEDIVTPFGCATNGSNVTASIANRTSSVAVCSAAFLTASTTVTLSPGDPFYTLVLSGDFTGVAVEQPIAVEFGVARGIARALSISAADVRLARIGQGSLIVEFSVPLSVLSVSEVHSRILAAVSTAGIWAELEAVVGFRVIIANFIANGDVSATSGPSAAVVNTGNGCGSGCIAGVTIASIFFASLVLFVVVTCRTSRRSSDSDPAAVAAAASRNREPTTNDVA